MASPQIKPDSTTESLVDIDTTSASPSPSDNYWYLRYYTQDYCGNTQLHRYMMAVPKYNYSLTKRLIDVTWPSSLLDIRNANGLTALHFGVMRNEPDIVRQLLVAGANLKSKNHCGYTPLHIASAQGHVDAAIALTKTFDEQEESKMKLKKLNIPDLSSSLHELNNAGETPLHVATHFGHLKIVELLVKLGANLKSERSTDGYKPLHIAAMYGHKEISTFILKNIVRKALMTSFIDSTVI